MCTEGVDVYNIHFDSLTETGDDDELVIYEGGGGYTKLYRDWGLDGSGNPAWLDITIAAPHGFFGTIASQQMTIT